MLRPYVFLFYPIGRLCGLRPVWPSLPTNYSMVATETVFCADMTQFCPEFTIAVQALASSKTLKTSPDRPNRPVHGRNY